MIRLASFLRDRRGASAAEFALVLPVMLLFLLGIIDVGRYIWNVNQVEKATQTGTRWAVATEVIPTGLNSYSFSISGGVPQGEVVPITKFPGVNCSSDTGVVSCQCKTENGGSCAFDATTANSTAFNALATRMNEIYGGIRPDNIEIDYDWSGLGYAGDPESSDVSPIVTVRVTRLAFRPIFLVGLINFSLPTLSYSLTMEDGAGAFAN